MSDPTWDETTEAAKAPAQSKPINPDVPPTWDETTSPQEEATTPGQQYLGAFEGVLKGATAGLSQIAEQHPDLIPGPLGIAARTLKAAGETTPEKVEAREKYNPIESGAAQVAGGLGFGALAGGGLTAVLPEITGVTGAAARIGAMATEGAGYSAVSGAATREAMGDPALNSQKILADAGFGALAGGTLGTVFESGAGLAKAMLRAKAGIPGATEAVSAAEGAAPDISPVVDAPIQEKQGVQPTSFKDIQGRVDTAVQKGQSLDMPQKAVLLDSVSRIPMENPVHPLQAESLDDQASRDAYKTALEMPGEKGDALRGYETLQRNELNAKTDQSIQDLSPGVNPTSDAVEGGNRASDAFTEQYQNEKKELGPVFKQLKETPLPEGMDAKAGMLDAMTKAVPGIAHMFETGGEDLGILPYKTSWGIDRATYNAAKEAMEALSEGHPDFEQLQNIRNGLSQNIDVTAQGPAASQIRAMKAAMMDYMQDAVQQASPDANVREAFKRYAINEQERGVIEKAFGASVGTPEFGALSKIKPEYIGDKIFANTANVAAAKNILEPKKFNQILANWISEAKSAATKDGVFSSNRFGSWLTKNQDALKIAFKENPESLQRLKDINTITRILPDSAPVNPSGTAKTLANYFKNVAGGVSSEDFLSKGATLVKRLYSEASEIVQHHKTMANLDAQLKGVSSANTVQLKIAKAATQVSNKIAENSKSIFSGGIAASVASMSLGDYDKNSKRIQELANDPQQFMDHMTKTTAAIHEAAPDVAQGLHNSMAKGIQFLNNKLPKPTQELPLSGKWSPSLPQKQTFNRYYQTVNDPVSALKRVKGGTLSNQDMEALQVVHPDLLEEMKMNVLQNIQKEKAHSLPSGTKIALSKFLGQPVDENMVPGSIQANQSTYLQPQQPKTTVKGTKNLNMAKRTTGESDE